MNVSSAKRVGGERRSPWGCPHHASVFKKKSHCLAGECAWCLCAQTGFFLYPPDLHDDTQIDSTAVGKLMAKMQQVGAGQASKSRYKRFIKNSWNARCCLSHPGKSSPARVGLLRRQTKIAPLVLFFDRRITISSSSLRLTLHYYYTVRADTWR